MPRCIRYAVIGLGHIAQAAVLPAFAQARRNSTLAALVSGDATKLRKLGKKYGVASLYGYEQYDRLLQSGDVDAVYIALPNHLHCDYAVRAARARVHVLCEKPMAMTVDECERMASAAEHGGVKLMIAYRLHFERANLEAVEIARSGKIGAPRQFSSVFTMTVLPGNIRVKRNTGGGVLYDIGIYCINAARMLFRDEPIEASAIVAGTLGDVEETVSALLRFSDGRVATLTCSFGASEVAEYRLVGTKGNLLVDPAYHYSAALRHKLTLGDTSSHRHFGERDQFAPELLYFSDCVLTNRDPEPSAREGLADVRVIEALYRSAGSGGVVKLPHYAKRERPDLRQELRKPPIKKPREIHAQSPSGRS